MQFIWQPQTQLNLHDKHINHLEQNEASCDWIKRMKCKLAIGNSGENNQLTDNEAEIVTVNTANYLTKCAHLI